MIALVPYVPDDFDEFWAEVVGEARRAPLDYHRSLTNDFDLPGFVVETLEFRGIDGRARHGWLAFPPGARRLPGFLWIPPYGRESLLPNAYGTRPGFVSISLNFFGYGAFYQEEYKPARGYFAEGAEDPRTWIFRRMFQDAYLALRVLQAQSEADETRLAVMGLSQGAGMAVWLGAFCPLVRGVCADLPFLAGINSTLAGPVYRYPPKELTDFMDTIALGRERVLHTLSYFDSMNAATRCRVSTQISLGLKDPACKPPNVRALYLALPGEKRLIEYGGGHDWDLGMVANNRAWLSAHLQ
ncbi:MAG: acetylxylan esterase [Fimbriimonas ginsengisoli]|uniref:Acetylxylan esterase n=1 Tax=Fimbriimonas ginsengisoli TaxID=1005039 RepID=A0A931PVS6_FIMGI|nr:acetylxylan esterase [Fimbriimonas ginsengisoli]